VRIVLVKPMRFPAFVSTVAVIGLCVPSVVRAADGVLKDAVEQKAWEGIAARFSSGPEVKTDNAKTLELAVSRLKGNPKGENGTASVTMDKASGKVVTVTSNSVGFTDEEVAGFAVFANLKALTLWHNGGEKFTGVGLAKLVGLENLTTVTLAGGSFADEGMVEAAKLPKLRELRVWHAKFSDKGVAAFRNHPTLESINMGAMWEDLLTDKSLESLSTCPKLKELVIAESWLTWEGGLRHLVKLKGQLTELDFRNCIIEPEEVEKLRAEMPGTKISWKGFSSGKDELKKGWIRPRAEKWIPKELLERVMAD